MVAVVARIETGAKATVFPGIIAELPRRRVPRNDDDAPWCWVQAGVASLRVDERGRCAETVPATASVGLAKIKKKKKRYFRASPRQYGTTAGPRWVFCFS